MSDLYVKIHTDKDVCRWLQEHVDNNEVKIHTRQDGGLDIDVTYLTAFLNPTDYKRVKNYLRKNGFTSRVGLHSRQRVDVEVPRDKFTVSYLIGDSIFNDILSKIKTIK